MQLYVKKLLLLFIVITMESTAQSNADFTPKQAAELAKNYQSKALLFREIPQFDRDSTVYYFDKATALLENSRPVQHQLLAEIYRDIIDRGNRSHPFIVVDSLAAKGMGHFNNIPRKDQDILLKYDLLQRWASIKVEEGELKAAVDLFTEALKLIQDDPRPEVRAKFLRQKASFIKRYGLPDEQKDFDKLTDQSYAIYKTLDQRKYASEIGGIYQSMVLRHIGINPDSTEHYFSLIKGNLKINKNPFSYGWYYAVRGDFLSFNKKNEEAKASLLESKKLHETYKMTNVDSYTHTLFVLGDIALEEGKYDETIDYYKKVREISLANNFKVSSIDALDALRDVYEQKDNFAQALAYSKQFNEEYLAYEEDKNKRSLRENELQINVLEQEKELDKNRQVQIIFVVIIFVGLALLALVYWNYKLKQKNNVRLAVLNTELNSKNELLDRKVVENELLLKEIHHRVKNNLEIVSSLLELQSAQIDDPSVQAAMLSSQNRVHSMGIIHQKLYQSEHLTSIEMRDYFVNLGDNIRNSFNAEGKVKIDCDMPELVLDVDTAISVGLITNELLTNAFKYAFEGKQDGNIKINLTRFGPNDDNLELRITDDGIGKIIGEKSKGTGFGTMLIDLLTKQLNGTISYQIENGTKVSLIFAKPVVL
jgi:two-component sensor histidine kinase